MLRQLVFHFKSSPKTVNADIYVLLLIFRLPNIIYTFDFFHFHNNIIVVEVNCYCILFDLPPPPSLFHPSIHPIAQNENAIQCL